MQTAHFRSVLPLGHPNVDRENGIIRDVSIITEGEIRGWDMFCDAACVQSVKACADLRGQAGVCAKFNPNTFDHGPGGIAGFFSNFHVNGEQLLADFHLDPDFPSRDYLLGLAERQPGSFGLSVDILYTTEKSGGKLCARCASLDAVTVVDVPAANSKGLFRVNDAGSVVDAPNQKSQVPVVIRALRRPKYPTALFKR